jgi:hypothetical protein
MSRPAYAQPRPAGPLDITLKVDGLLRPEALHLQREDRPGAGPLHGVNPKERIPMRTTTPAVAAVLRALAVAGLLLGAGVAAAQAKEAGRKLDPDADRILRAMSSYLGGLRTFTADYDVDNEVIDTDGQKLQFSSSGSIAAQRPGQLHATRRGGFADVELFLNGGTATLLGKNQNVYLQVGNVATIDAAIDAIRSQVDVDLAGADLLYANPAEGLLTDVSRGTYLGPAVVNGIACDHIAFRAEKVDWQLWVQRGDKPLPLKYSITSKWVTGAPQYSIRFHRWNVQPQLEARRFDFKPPSGAKQVEMVATNELGDPTTGGQP